VRIAAAVAASSNWEGGGENGGENPTTRLTRAGLLAEAVEAAALQLGADVLDLEHKTLRPYPRLG
jgi:hypothetical protein